MSDFDDEEAPFLSADNESLLGDVDSQGESLLSEEEDDDSSSKKKVNFFKKNTDSNNIVLGERYVIHTQEVYSNFEHTFADSYIVSDVNDSENDYVGVVMKDRYPARYNVLSPMAQIDGKNIIPLIDWGTVWWPDDKCFRFVLIFRKPPGKKIMDNMSVEFEAYNEDTLRFSIIKPLLHTLMEMYDKGVSHGCINPSTLYRVTSDGSAAVLGECLSGAPGINQRCLFDTVERAMCDPHCKGEAQARDDVYALGMTVAVLARGRNPLRGRKDAEIIEMKEEKGSFALMTEGVRLSPSISEFLRGTLADDYASRWGLEEIASWLDGTRLPPKQKGVARKATRAYEFGTKKYWRARALASDLTLNPEKSVEIIENGSIAQWLSRALNDQKMADALTESITKAQMSGRGEGYAERLVTLACMVLDPVAPIRYRGISVLPHGIGWALAHAYVEGRPIQNLSEIIRDRYAWLWLNFKENIAIDTQELIRKFDNASKVISRRGVEYGIERCLYELSPNVPCMSEKMKSYYVMECDDLLRALDDIGENAIKQRMNIVEKQLFTFISVRDRKDLAGMFRLIESVDKIKSSLAVVTLFRDLQFRFCREELPGLTMWLGRYCKPIIDRYHNRKTREDIYEKLEKTVKSGDLNRLVGLIDNPQTVRKDQFEFQKAQRDYYEMEVDRLDFKKKLKNDKNFGRETGRQVASIVSLVFGATLAALVMVFRMSMYG